MTTFREAADLGFGKLVDLWNFGDPFLGGPGGCFWFAANAMHAAIDYLKVTGTIDGKGPHQDKTRIKTNKTFAEQGLAVYLAMKPKASPDKWVDEGIWIDDYGWWGIAFMNAYNSNNLGYTNEQKGHFFKAANECWVAMHAAWRDTPVPSNDNKVPLPISGGISNTLDLSLPLAGRNCVTNEVFWQLSNLLYEVGQDQAYLDPKTDSSDWFSKANSLNLLIDDRGLIRERFVNASWYIPNYSWLGDQGLFLISCFSNQRRGSDMNVNMAYKIAEAVKQFSKAEVLDEPLFPNYSQYQLDYSSGKGVFIRNLAIYNSWLSHQPSGSLYDDWILKNGRAVWEHQLPDYQFRYYWTGQPAEPKAWGGDYGPSRYNTVLQAAGLSALNACVGVAANKPIEGSLVAK